MHLGAILRILGVLSLFSGGVLFLFSLLAFFLFQEIGEGEAFLWVSFLAGGVGFLLLYFTPSIKEESIHFREAFASVSFGWLLMGFYSALPFYLSGSIPSFTDAFFESISGLTTTGASILSHPSLLPLSIALWRSFIQWIGGMGIIVFLVAILTYLGVGGLQLLQAEVPGVETRKLVPRISLMARLLWGIYVAFTIAEFLLLYIGGMPPFEAINHAFTTLPTGGFSPLDGSIGEYAFRGDPMSLYFELVISFFMFLAGINFSLHYRVFSKKSLWYYIQDPEFRWYIGFIGVGILLCMWDLLFISNKASSIEEALRFSLFQVLSIQTTTGYATQNFGEWGTLAKITLFLLMFIGGCAGSTAGGIKVIRFLILTKGAFITVEKSLQPHLVRLPRIGGKVISREVEDEVSYFFTLALLLYGVGVVIISFIPGVDIESAFSMVAACYFNIGPGLGLVGPSENFGFLPSWSKWFLAFYMLLGRLELLPILVLFHRRLWKK